MFKFSQLSVEDKRSLLQHLEDLRKSLLISLIAIIVAAGPAFYFSDTILQFLQRPLASTGLTLNFTGVFTPFYIKLKIALIGGLILAFPVVSWSVWHFIAPALFTQEKKYVYILFPITIVLFVGGVVFSYFTVLPIALYFLVVVMAGDLTPLITVDDYISKVLAFTIPFGLFFELPVAIFFLTKIGVINYKMLARQRKYALLVIFILAAALTPGPDPVSQCLMGIPIYFLYEISIVVSRLSGRPAASEEDADAEESSDLPGTGAEAGIETE